MTRKDIVKTCNADGSPGISSFLYQNGLNLSKGEISLINVIVRTLISVLCVFVSFYLAVCFEMQAFTRGSFQLFRMLIFIMKQQVYRMNRLHPIQR